MLTDKKVDTQALSTRGRFTLRGHLHIARTDHWVKNVFVLPGIIVALSIDRTLIHNIDWLKLAVGFLAVCLIASSNYVINEVLDAPFDRLHPTKCKRPTPAGLVHIPTAYAQWILLMVVGLALSWFVSAPFTLTMAVLWIMGCIYNIPPVRSKDLPYLDVLSESINNPLRMLAGWYMTATLLVPPTSLLISYWMIGAYFMAIKRYAEYREIADPLRCASYRKSFSFYNEQRLLVSIMFYAALSMLFFGAFIVRYRLELILCFPLVSLVMAQYLALAFQEDSAVQNPEKLYKQKGLMAGVAFCWVAMILLLFVNVPAIYQIFQPTTIVR